MKWIPFRIVQCFLMAAFLHSQIVDAMQSMADEVLPMEQVQQAALDFKKSFHPKSGPFQYNELQTLYLSREKELVSNDYLSQRGHEALLVFIDKIKAALSKKPGLIVNSYLVLDERIPDKKKKPFKIVITTVYPRERTFDFLTLTFELTKRRGKRAWSYDVRHTGIHLRDRLLSELLFGSAQDGKESRDLEEENEINWDVFVKKVKEEDRRAQEKRAKRQRQKLKRQQA